MVSGVGYNPERWPEGARNDFVDLRWIITDLCVMDFGGPNHGIRVVSLHPGVSFEQVQNATGFSLLKIDDLPTTPAPTEEQLDVIRRLDPHNLRASVIKNNPPGVRAA